MIPLRISLEPEEIPSHWYNVVADLVNPPAPPLAPDGNPVTPEQMGAIFPMPILEQEMSAERWIAIPEEVRQIYALWRPSPLCRALRLEQALGKSSTSTRGFRRPVRTSPTPLCRKPSTTRWSAPGA